MKNLIRIQVLVILCVSAFGVLAQKNKKVDYSIQLVDPASVPITGELNIQASSFKLYQLDITALRSGLEGVTYREGAINGFIGEISLPHPDGTLKKYSVKRNQTMHPKLNEKFNEIRTYDAYAMDGSGAFGKWDITPQGLHAMIFIPGESTVFIDPYIRGNTSYYIVYRKKDFITSKVKECHLDVPEDLNIKNPTPTQKAMFGTCDLRTYRLAVAATGEYTAFHGGTLVLAQAAQVTTMNRVNGVYEKDIAITMVIVPNNNLIVYTNTGSDPYTNGNTGTMITQNQTTCDNVIGSANYDIGHVFGTNSGGLAGLGVVCTGGQKARGVTGSGAPVGDPFDIDYVAHEMGHQFGGNHTQNNNCNSVAAARREPGSASTIMGYAGICAPDVQSNSDDYFHGYNLGEISIEILSTGHQCEVITPLNNTPPTIVSTGGNISVPISTPFILTGNATDPNGDVLTYLWEQMDNEASTQPPVATATGGPNFRSFDPTTNPSRYFPNLQALAANGPFTWEVLPSVSRVMDFRLTVKDNHAVGSCNDYTDITVTTVAAAGPFVLTYPTATGITWASGGTQTVTWNVANTTAAPISCANVKLVLSVDGGLTYPYVLAASTPNDGTQLINVPSVSSTTCRVMVISSAETFFDISNNNFTITCSTPVTPTFSTPTTYCQNDVVTQLPTTSSNSVTGTWNNQLSTATPGTATYIFTPTTGSCASPLNLTVTVNAATAPTFNSISTLCQNSTPPTLPATSTNGINGTWNSTISTVAPGTNTYTFTPSAGQCATTASMPVTVQSQQTPTFATYGPYCLNEVVAPWPTTSSNGFNGSWNMQVNTSVAGQSSYTFTPNAGQCATSFSQSVTVNNPVTPVFTQVGPYCQGDNVPGLSQQSDNGVNGSWSPNFTTGTVGTTTYSFTPNAGSCATGTTMSVNINPSPSNQVTQNGLTLTATQNGASYQWIDCNNNNAPIAGATAQSYTTTAITGSYAVVVTSAGCSSTSLCTVIDQSGLEEMDGATILMYPNPTDKTLYVEWEGLDLMAIEVHDAFGKLVWMHDKKQFDGTIDVAAFSNGMYFIKLKTNKGNYIRKFLKE